MVKLKRKRLLSDVSDFDRRNNFSRHYCAKIPDEKKNEMNKIASGVLPQMETLFET